MIIYSRCKGWVHYECSKLPNYQLTIHYKTKRMYTCEACTDIDTSIIDHMNSKIYNPKYQRREEERKNRCKKPAS